ncbi:Oxygen regulatory protein NreC [Pontiella desulfatans]|uniref:Oxygen regulatory protein NreC n=1 Tax=Pontiella desulfatans TaxID=2750659 RepID=A0A6C2TZV4_PONDE|nr:response regulator transcription factor [Pontiella desulfatans]VGO13143.1 Oxygen regulatory protein NreC [Pontiella desulfatans]
MTTPINIMLVEDNAVYREVLEMAITRDPNLELTDKVGTAERALQHLQPSVGQKTPDLILLDLSLPGMSGLEAIPWIKKYVPNTKIIILTQSENEADIINAITQGVSGYLLKSATVQQIKEGIQTVMSGGSPLDPAVAKYILNTFKAPTSNRPESTPHTDGEEDTPLTDREEEILSLLSQGLVKKEIAEKLNISYFTVSTHVRHIYEKLEVPNAPAAISKAYKTGIFGSHD